MVGKLSRDDMFSPSICPIVFGVSPYMNRNEILKQCIDAKHGKNVRTEQTTQQRVGDLLEPLILQETAEMLGLSNLEKDHTTPVHHPTLPIQGSLDGTAFAKNVIIQPTDDIMTQDGRPIVLQGKGVLESKSTAASPTDIPPEWRGVMQTKCLMSCLDYDWGVVSVLYRSTLLKLYVFRRDFEFEKQLADVALDFDRRVKEEDYYPPVTNVEAAVAFSSVEPDKIVNMDNDLITTATESYLLAKEQIKKYTDLANKSMLTIQNFMQNAEKGTHPKYEYKWGSRTYKAQPEKIIPAKESYTTRNKSVTIKELNDSWTN